MTHPSPTRRASELLAQLHRLRGRVGRGRQDSACVLLYDPPLSETAQKRLDILRRTDDGFAIAETDLELRGGGDALGLKQRSEEHTSELQSLMRISYAVFCLKKKNNTNN